GTRRRFGREQIDALLSAPFFISFHRREDGVLHFLAIARRVQNRTRVRENFTVVHLELGWAHYILQKKIFSDCTRHCPNQKKQSRGALNPMRLSLPRNCFVNRYPRI